MSFTPHPECEKCRWWAQDKKERGGEVFIYLWGLGEYDIDKARKLTADHEVQECPIERLAPLVDYPPIDGVLIDPMKIHVDESHIDHVDLDTPIILAFGLKPREKAEGHRTLMVIDGSHRIAKAIKTGAKTVKCVVLTMDETDKILKDRRPKKKKK